MVLVPIEPRILRIATGADFVERRNGRGVMVRDGRGYLIRDIHGPSGRCTRRNCVKCAVKLLEQNGLYVYPPTPPTVPVYPVPAYPGTGQNQHANASAREPRGPDVTAHPPVQHPAQERLNHLVSRLRQRIDHYQRLTFGPDGRRADRVNAQDLAQAADGIDNTLRRIRTKVRGTIDRALNDRTMFPDMWYG